MFTVWLYVLAAIHFVVALAIISGLSSGKLVDPDGSQLGGRVMFVLFAGTAVTLAVAGYMIQTTA